MECNVYGKRISTEQINLKNVVMGIGTKGEEESWAFLEHIDNGVFADLESLSVYKTDKDVGVLNVTESGVNRLVITRTAARELDSIFGVAKLKELFTTAKSFFDNIKGTKYKDEIFKIREILGKYESLFYEIENGKDVYLSVDELTNMLGVLKRIYSYTFGSPMNENIKEEVPTTNLRKPDETLDLEDVYVLTAKVKNPIFENVYKKEGIVLELMPDVLQGEDANLKLFKNAETEEYYYVNEERMVVKPKRRLPGIKALTNIESFSRPVSIIKAIEVASANRDKFNDEDNKSIDDFTSMPFNFAQVRDIRDNKKFIYRSYHLFNGVETPKMDYSLTMIEDLSMLDSLLTTLEVFSANKRKTYFNY